MAAQSSEAVPGAEPGEDHGERRPGGGLPDRHAPGAQPADGPAPAGALWGRHGADLARVTAIDLALLAKHLLLYPTGIFPERAPAPTGKPTPPAHPPTPDRQDPHDTQDPQGATPPPALPLKGRPHPPVLLLHGFVDNRSAFTLLRRSLLDHGWTRVQALNYSPLTSDIRTAAELLGPHIERICAESGHRRVDIVAHSLGGLIGRYYVQRLGGDARVRTLVTLGTPHSGTRAVPALAPHPLARQMRPGSAVLEELAEPAPGCRTRFVAFWSDLDQLMIPVGSARLEHPDLLTTNVQVSGVGHLALPVHGTVAAEIRGALTGKRALRAAIEAA